MVLNILIKDQGLQLKQRNRFLFIDDLDYNLLYILGDYV